MEPTNEKQTLQLRCGDVVHVAGEGDLMVAFAEGDRMVNAGWPAASWPVDRCQLVEQASDEQHRMAVDAWIGCTNDWRRQKVMELYVRKQPTRGHLVEQWLRNHRGNTYRDGGATAAVVAELDKLETLINERRAIQLGNQTMQDELVELREKLRRRSERHAAEIAEATQAATRERDEARAEVDRLRAELRCPDCGCATPDDAGAAECGCDGPRCAIPVGMTLAVAYAEARAEVERLTKERNGVVAKLDRYRTDVGLLRATLQEDDHRAWVAMGRPNNTRTTNVVLICTEVERLRAELEQERTRAEAAEAELREMRKEADRV